MTAWKDHSPAPLAVQQSIHECQPDARSTPAKDLPLLLGLLAALFVGRALRKMLRRLFGMYMARHYSGLYPFG